MALLRGKRCSQLNVSQAQGRCLPKCGCDYHQGHVNSCTDLCHGKNASWCPSIGCDYHSRENWKWIRIHAVVPSPSQRAWHSAISQPMLSSFLTIFGGMGISNTSFSETWELTGINSSWAPKPKGISNPTNGSTVVQVLWPSWRIWEPPSLYEIIPPGLVYHTAVSVRSGMLVWGGTSCPTCTSDTTDVWCLDIVLPEPKRVEASALGDGTPKDPWKVQVKWQQPKGPMLTGFRILLCDTGCQKNNGKDPVLWFTSSSNISNVTVLASSDSRTTLLPGREYQFQASCKGQTYC